MGTATVQPLILLRKAINRARNAVTRGRFKAVFERMEDDQHVDPNFERLRDLVGGKRVALVGNASSIFQSYFGAEIDEHDIVIRLNQGIIADPEHQGRRTHILGVSCKMEWDWARSTFGLMQVLWLTPNLYSMSSSFMRHADQIANAPVGEWRRLTFEMGGARPSSGLIVINLLRHLMEPRSIRLFGFDWKASPTFYHRGADRRGPHEWTQEAALVRNWMKLDSRMSLALPQRPPAEQTAIR